jgi:hypothetical protein
MPPPLIRCHPFNLRSSSADLLYAQRAEKRWEKYGLGMHATLGRSYTELAMDPNS